MTEFFRAAVHNGHLHIVKWLLEINPTLNISVDDDYIFRFACDNYQVELVQLLRTINRNYNYIIINNFKKIRIISIIYFY